MALNSTDWIVIAAYLLLNLAISLYYRRRSSGSTEEFFVSGRNVSWWLAGTSMVATTFAADTPLFVTGVVARNGISGNWIWWSQCLSGMMTVFFFARLSSSSFATKARPLRFCADFARSISAD
jgi:Na+/proline symporter